MEKLIIIRGPAGAGKSSVAKAIKDRSDRPTLLIEQDQFRRGFNDQGAKANVPVWQMVKANTMIGLENGFDVILEGILNIQKPHQRETFERIFAAHPNENYIFYIDISFEETIKRHDTRPAKTQFGEEEMKEWWSLASPMGHTHETTIPESSTLEETIRTIAKVAALTLKGNT